MSRARLPVCVPHAPSTARAIRRAVRAGDGDPKGLLGQARDLEPAHGAPVLALLACDPRLDADDRTATANEAGRRAAAVERIGQKAETWSEVLKALGAAAALDVVDRAVTDVEAMPDGEWTHDAITAIAGHVGADGRRRLLARALRNPGFEADGAKAVLDAADLEREVGLVEAARAIDDPDVRRRALGHLHQAGAADVADAAAAAWSVADRAARWEALRALAYQCQDAQALDQVAASTQGRDPDETARLLCALAARADRLGERDRMEGWLAQAIAAAAQLDEKPRRKVARKVATAMEKAGLDAGPAQALAGAKPESGQEGGPAPTVLAPATGHALALVDAYEGGLSVAHLRAAARGAALCAAFGHDLILAGFPTTDLGAFVAAATSETSIGEDARPLQALVDAGRLALVSDVSAIDGRGLVVATTPRPDAAKAVRLGELRGNMTLAVGLGSKGLPSDLLERADRHYELTGHGISLETATAMGILADRLARVPSSA